MARREFLQLAKPYNSLKHKIAGFLASEKLDGTRCWWDGGVSRGMPTESVPYANLIDPKTGERKKKIKPVATGLWSRYGNPIMAPDEFLNLLPTCPLDGELWAGRSNFQLCRSICAGDTPDPRFMTHIKYAVYGCPPPNGIFADGEIKNSNFHLTVGPAFMEWTWEHANEDWENPACKTFKEELEYLNKALYNGPDSRVFLHNQRVVEDHEDVERLLNGILDLGGEGIVLRDPKSHWTPKRVVSALKYKPYDDAEVKVTGFTSGRRTDKGSKHLGKIGALITEFEGQRLEVAGLTDEERLFADEGMSLYAKDFPGVDMPTAFKGKHFKVGDVITIKYRELSDDGIPKEARYFRRPMPERQL